MGGPPVQIHRSCVRCGVIFAMPRRAFRGHWYCSRECSAAARLESVRRARERHRRSPEGTADHRDRERDRRRRRRAERVGDQGRAAESFRNPSAGADLAPTGQKPQI